jgi:hypothetical protein
VAAALREGIVAGSIAVGQQLTTDKQLGVEFEGDGNRAASGCPVAVMGGLVEALYRAKTVVEPV